MEESRSIKKDDVCAVFWYREEKKPPPPSSAEGRDLPLSQLILLQGYKSRSVGKLSQERRRLSHKGAPGLKAWLLLPDSS